MINWLFHISISFPSPPCATSHTHSLKQTKQSSIDLLQIFVSFVYWLGFHPFLPPTLVRMTISTQTHKPHHISLRPLPQAVMHRSHRIDISTVWNVSNNILQSMAKAAIFNCELFAHKQANGAERTNNVDINEVQCFEWQKKQWDKNVRIERNFMRWQHGRCDAPVQSSNGELHFILYWIPYFYFYNVFCVFCFHIFTFLFGSYHKVIAISSYLRRQWRRHGKRAQFGGDGDCCQPLQSIEIVGAILDHMKMLVGWGYLRTALSSIHSVSFSTAFLGQDFPNYIFNIISFI